MQPISSVKNVSIHTSNLKARTANLEVLTAVLLRTYYSGIRRCIFWPVVPDVSVGLYCLHFQVPSSSKTVIKDSLILEEEGTKVLRNVGDFHPNTQHRLLKT